MVNISHHNSEAQFTSRCSTLSYYNKCDVYSSNLAGNLHCNTEQEVFHHIFAIIHCKLHLLRSAWLVLILSLYRHSLSHSDPLLLCWLNSILCNMCPFLKITKGKQQFIYSSSSTCYNIHLFINQSINRK